jgi:TPP-dependent pyruvate/acetoin dehydrogenase alpha subunit
MSNKSEKEPPRKTPALINDSKLQQLYSTMLECRILASHARSFEGKSFWEGKEASIVGAGSDLRPDDAVVFSSGAAGGCFLRGVPLRSIFTLLRERASNNYPQKSKTLVSTEAQPQSALATGIAYAHNSRHKKSVVVALLSEHSEECHTGQSALEFAGMRKLPIVYVYSVNSTDATQMYSYDFPVIPVDGHDAVAVYRVAFECKTRAREGGGPSVIMCSFSSVKEPGAKRRDPLRNMEEYLSAKGLFEKDRKQLMIHSFERELAEAKNAIGHAARNSGTKRQSQNIFFI